MAEYVHQSAQMEVGYNRTLSFPKNDAKRYGPYTPYADDPVTAKRDIAMHVAVEKQDCSGQSCENMLEITFDMETAELDDLLYNDKLDGLLLHPCNPPELDTIEEKEAYGRR